MGKKSYVEEEKKEHEGRGKTKKNVMA